MAHPARTLLLRHQDDRRLARLVQAGDDGAFEVVVRRYRRPLLRHCERVVGSDHAEDVLQHTFINAHRALQRGDDVLDLGPWLHRIAHNAALSSLRGRPPGEEPLDAADHAGAAGESAADAAERRERLRETVASVRGLPARQREAIVMYVGDDRSYDEIAAELGLTTGAVKQLLNRARGTLRAGVTAITPFGLLLRHGAAEAEAFAGVAAVAGGAGLLTKGAAVSATVIALAGGGAVATGVVGEEPSAASADTPALTAPAGPSAPAGATPAAARAGGEAAPPADPSERRERARTRRDRGAAAGAAPAGGEGSGAGVPAGTHDDEGDDGAPEPPEPDDEAAERGGDDRDAEKRPERPEHDEPALDEPERPEADEPDEPDEPDAEPFAIPEPPDEAAGPDE
jgi:RNA polymerase sigma factor (sigma-70 family)